ncbi:salicylate hydroxylase [Hyaloscypha sp. PMI_1271]|nr:salicylate hydroxylase [Hyaloscypha sp. PMI_1271]
MESLKDNLNWHPKARTPLNILIIGAGITGLTSALALSLSGHRVTIYEAANSLTEIGAGLQIAPNASRILARLGILGDVMEKANVLEHLSLRRWKDDSEIGTAPLMPGVGEKYGAPLCVIHRGDLQSTLLKALASLPIPVEIHLGKRVIAIHPNFDASIKLESGELVSGDILICADGVKSSMRQYFLSPASQSNSDGKRRARPISTGDAAYRVLIPRSQLVGDQRALELLNSNVGMRWMGPGGHIMAYPIRNNEMYNVVLLHPQKKQGRQLNGADDESWTRKGSKKEMLEWYAGWNDTVKSLLSYVPDGDVAEWNLHSHPPLPTWVNGKCVLVGDAAHPMLPYVAQGAAQGIEDAGALACVLSKLDSVDQIESALNVFQAVRKERAEKIQSSASATRQVLHLPDGEEQRVRDQRMRGAGKPKNPDLWADEQWQQYMWGVDVMREVLEAWEAIALPRCLGTIAFL